MTQEEKNKRMLEILDETVEYYSNNPRAVDENDKCQYLTKDGRMCAVGRKLIRPEEVQRISDEHRTKNGISVVFIPNLNRRLHKDCRGLPVYFWSVLQNLHDYSDYWGNGGLTEAGNEAYEGVKDGIKTNQYT